MSGHNTSSRVGDAGGRGGLYTKSQKQGRKTGLLYIKE